MGLSAAGGSCANTSQAYAASCPLCNASATAFSSISPPRAVLMSTNPLRAFDKSSAFTKALLSGFKGQWRETTADVANASSIVIFFTPSGKDSAAWLVTTHTSASSTWSNSATFLPILPHPTIVMRCCASSSTASSQRLKSRLRAQYPPRLSSA